MTRRLRIAGRGGAEHFEAGFAKTARLALEQALSDGAVVLCIAYSAVLGTALSNVGWYRSIARVGVARAASFFYWLPIFGMGFSALLLGEVLTVWHLAGLLLVLLATRLAVQAYPQPKTH